MQNTDVNTPIASNGGDWRTRFETFWGECRQKLEAHLGGSLKQVAWPGKDPTDVPVFYVSKEKIVDALRFARDALGFNFLSDLTATDEMDEPYEGARFFVVYNLLSHAQKCRIRFKTWTDESVPTAIPVWVGADWAEREAFDMYGVRFEGHPDLRRIVMDERWEGHPLRKDYPLRGYQIFVEPEKINEELLK